MYIGAHILLWAHVTYLEPDTMATKVNMRSEQIKNQPWCKVLLVWRGFVFTLRPHQPTCTAGSIDEPASSSSWQFVCFQFVACGESALSTIPL